MTKFSEIDPNAPRAELYDILDSPEKRTWGVELETAEFLYGLVRADKPELVVESGTGYGGSTRQIARALVDNDRGHLSTFESNLAYFGQCEGLDRTSFHRGEVSEWNHPLPDIVFLDSAPIETRHRELLFWLPKPVFLLIHDSIGHEGTRRILEGQGGLEIRVPCGLWMRDGRKPSPGGLS